ncbi:MAG TPA: ribonuclease E inhibitor RraB [Steroidobacteraceae bacterium]|nr:ribonuclease E inhibitor RraB [Steroidobacteraceae bacterium]
MSWLLLFVALAAAAVIFKLIQSVRKGREAHGQDFDTKLIGQLRARGLDPFKDHEVDFFFALPDEAACAAVNSALESQGFRVDVKAVPDGGEFPFSVHGSKTMRVHAAEMRELTRQFRELAAANRGRYDGWSTTAG